MEHFLSDLEHFKNTPVLLLDIVLKYILISMELSSVEEVTVEVSLKTKFRACLQQGRVIPALTHFLFSSLLYLQGS